MCNQLSLSAAEHTTSTPSERDKRLQLYIIRSGSFPDAFLGVFSSIMGSHGSSFLVIPLIGCSKPLARRQGHYHGEYVTKGLWSSLFVLLVYIRSHAEESMYPYVHEQPKQRYLLRVLVLNSLFCFTDQITEGTHAFPISGEPKSSE
jgi:hypothetical protein